jgi:probable HAF family extracellular repeat protein
LLGLFACREAPTVPSAKPPLTANAAAGTNAPQSLGTLGTAAQAFSISANGTVVGQYDKPVGASSEIRAFIWTSKTGMTALTPPAGSTEDWASAVNDGAQAVGYSRLPSQNAILWSKGVPYNLGTLDNAGGASAASGINRAGQIVGVSTFAGPFGPTGQHAMMWVPTAANGTTGTMYDLGALEANGSSRASAINEAGQVVGTASVGGVLHAFLWTPSVPNGTTGTMVDLDPGGPYSEAYGLNDRGDVVGQREAAGGVRAFVWNAATGLRDIGTWPTTGGNSAALGVDRLGRVVGFAIDNSLGARRAFVWTSKGGMQDLGTLGGANGQAWATNPKGQAVGSSQNASGETHATLWTLP